MDLLPKGVMFYGVYFYKARNGPHIEIKHDGYRLAAKVDNKIIGIYIDNQIYEICTKDKRQIFLTEPNYTHEYRIPPSYKTLFAVTTPLNPNAPSYTPIGRRFVSRGEPSGK